MPSLPLDKSQFQIPQGVIPADPEFYKPVDIDLLIGAEFFYQLLRSGQVQIKGQLAVYQETLLGWIIAGRISKPRFSKSTSKVTCNLIKFLELPILWELGADSSSNVKSSEELACETHFEKNIQKTKDAFQRLHSLERKFEKDPFLKEQYTECIHGYLKDLHMTQVPDHEPIDHVFYLPHHAVVITSSLTRRVRVVFDGSAKTCSGFALNDSLMIGPTIQEDLFSIITRFRCVRYALTVDIEQMYSLNTVTFETACAPFLAIGTLHQLAEDERESFPIAFAVLKRDFYVDDLLTGTQTFEEAINLRNDLISLLKRGGFNLRKWGTNDPELTQHFSTENAKTFMSLNSTESIKALGIHWDAANDYIFYTVNFPNSKELFTKRSILLQISKLFDPLGLLSPVVVLEKIFIQLLWKIQLTWDSPVLEDIQDFWIKYKEQLQLLSKVKFSRFISTPDTAEIQLHGFCDASENAYRACLYLRSTDRQGRHRSVLISSKSRVAPLNANSLPRLELCAANLLVKLYTVTFKTFPFLLKTFVANRVAEIQAASRSQDWRHGPHWLSHDSSTWPQLPFHEKEIPETKTPSTYCLRFIHNLKIKDKTDKRIGNISTEEYKIAFQKVIKITQAEAFPKELHLLSQKSPVNSKSSLRNLNPFLESGLLNFGGRLTHADLPESQIHPIILPKNHPITKLLIREEREKLMHAGINATLYSVRETECIMGNLPQNRVSFSRPFVNVGVDYCGPFFIKERRHRNVTKVKTYVADFVCQATKAVNLELACYLTTGAFLACLKRFFARRGRSQSISSDNATNFVGANKELRELYKTIQFFENDKEIQSFFVKNGISWHFIPPRAPHFGGLWEAVVALETLDTPSVRANYPHAHFNLTRTDAVTTKQKAQAWEKISQDFDVKGISPELRSANKFKVLWNNLKRNARKHFSNFHQETFKPGKENCGGSNPLKVAPLAMQVEEIIGTEHPRSEGVVPLEFNNSEDKEKSCVADLLYYKDSRRNFFRLQQYAAAITAQREQVRLNKIVLGRKIKKTSNERYRKRFEEVEALIQAELKYINVLKREAEKKAKLEKEI
ncbi:uncharacterized protein LOC117182625 [Belonocnema kinseyi]|uniref:uncharacterized protein LOC117182625 n=1 Tax=Belonocnema kinseyi TaxID=2817044 RepID=UPI00143DC4A0|nr:uncharacterized protein LOC117182625 [Belonocnema kinseyi]